MQSAASVSGVPAGNGAAESVVLSVALPGRAGENVGVLVIDRLTGAPWRRFRRDLAELAPDDEADVLGALEEDIALKLHEMGGPAWLDWLEEHASHFLRVSDREQHSGVGDLRQLVNWLYHRHVRPKALPFRTHLPVYSAEAAAGRWGPERNVEEEPMAWIEAPSTLRRLTPDLFVARVQGRSMEPLIPSGSLCVFRGGEALAGSRQGRRVLVVHYGEPGEQRFTIKRYESVKRRIDEDREERARIILHPLNPEFESWEIGGEPDAFGEDSGRIRVIGEFVCVLDDDPL